jgi:glycine/D-amino acid oxidase-like deaminating enzyme
MPVRHVPFWLDRVARARRPSYPALRKSTDTGVVIVGGGLTGCACAWSFAAAGVKVVLLEANALGTGATAGNLGLVREDFDASFHEASAAYGLRAARQMWSGLHRGSLDFAAALRRLQVRCDLAPLDLLHVAARDPRDTKRLHREYQSRRDAGLEHSWLTAPALLRETAIAAGGAIKTRGAGIDPYRACLGLAAGAVSRGAAIHEGSAVQRIRASRRHVEVATERATVKADAVVVATSDLVNDLRALRRHLKVFSSYAVVTEPLPAAVRRETGHRRAALRDWATPPHQLRWLADDRVLVAGGDQLPVPARAREKTLIQRTGQLMYELTTIYPAISGLQPEWSWEFPSYETVDGLPFVGLHRNFPRHLFALGGTRHGAALPWLAARVLLRQYQGEPAKADEVFGFSRILQA